MGGGDCVRRELIRDFVANSLVIPVTQQQYFLPKSPYRKPCPAPWRGKFSKNASNSEAILSFPIFVHKILILLTTFASTFYPIQRSGNVAGKTKIS
jgi:hypothetical protein